MIRPGSLAHLPSTNGHADHAVRPPTIVGPHRPRAISDADRTRFENNLAELFTALGMDLDTPGTADTPRRHLQALIDATAGYEGDPKLLTVFPTECHGDANCELAQIVEGPIPFHSLCEHHALPFFGRAYVGYVAHDQIIGISKLTRLVRVITRRFGVQERMTHQAADAMVDLLGAHGVAVYLEADHLCTQMRGVREHDAMTRTTAFRGVYEKDAALRSEFYDISGLRRGSR
ncbi:MAG TPA: GTP cyclohydrolase I [Candidatus Limnocylindria bacterium]|nr:GTP cyclohydrolase I [Candidatus Limnocylindria bacterium]